MLAIEAAGGLPETLIHGDVHYDNALVDENTGKVTGIIDFEFASYDWRMMECAAGLSKYVGEKDPTPFVQSYITGFCRRATPTEAEIDAIRTSSNFVSSRPWSISSLAPSRARTTSLNSLSAPTTTPPASSGSTPTPKRFATPCAHP